ncbi:MAG: hypothetical protein AB7S66_06860 [Sphaerochaeta sp.]
MNKLRGGTAAVFIEPVGPESGTRPLDKNFNKEAENSVKPTMLCWYLMRW